MSLATHSRPLPGDGPVARPPWKWVGGKTQLLSEILPRLPAKIKTYYEPFVGGGAVFFALAEEKRFKHANLSDSNEELINAYRTLASDPAGVIKKLKHHTHRHSEAWFYTTRSLDPKELSRVDRAARFIYLNKTCFNGLYRVNKKGAFNVPFGKYANPTICDEVNLLVVSGVLRGSKALATAGDFESTTLSAKRGDAVYFDPPYVPVSDTANFTAYAVGGFDYVEQVRLRDVAARLVKRGVHVLLSNSATALVRKLYEGFKIEEVSARRAINSKGDKRGNVGELLISGKS